MDIDSEASFFLILWIFPNNMESSLSLSSMKTPAIGLTIVDNVRDIWHFIYQMINVQVPNTKTVLEWPMVASGVCHNNQIYTSNIQR